MAIRLNASHPGAPPHADEASPARDAPHIFRRYLLAWLGMTVIAPVNGVAREALLRDRLGEMTGRQVSSLSLVVLLFGYVWLIEKRWPIAKARTAALIGVLWAAMAAAFDFVFGLAEGKSAGTLIGDYNLVAGRTWGLVVVAVALVLPVVRWLQRR